MSDTPVVTNARLHGCSMDGWECFHCGEVFTTVGGASDHFGATPNALPGCLVRVQLGDERGLEMALRKAEQHIADLTAQLTDQKQQVLNWTETAAEYARNCDYYRGLVVQCGESIGEAAYICDDGARSLDVLCAKVPELVADLTAQLAAQQWVPVSERLPDLHGCYIGCHIPKRYSIKNYIPSSDDIWGVWYEFGKFVDEPDGLIENTSVTHWMPLPAPSSNEVEG